MGMLLAYTDTGDIISTLDYVVLYDETKYERPPMGLVDFDAHEAAGGDLTDIWNVASTNIVVKGSKVWPEWIGGKAHEFTVELVGPPGAKHIAALVHKTSGYRRERAVVDSAIAKRISDANGLPADIRDIVGGPDRPLLLDEQGRTTSRPIPIQSHLPLVKAHV
jgi:hypothetical protein